MVEVPVRHLGAALLALIISGAAHWWLRRGANPDAPASAVELAYLRGGPQLARYACLAELLRLRMVRVYGNGSVVARNRDPLPARSPRLLVAIRHVLRKPSAWWEVAAAPRSPASSPTTRSATSRRWEGDRHAMAAMSPSSK